MQQLHQFGHDPWVGSSKEESTVNLLGQTRVREREQPESLRTNVRAELIISTKWQMDADWKGKGGKQEEAIGKGSKPAVIG